MTDNLFDEPVFCFTSDIDWAPESAIERTLEIFSRFNIPLTPFITHRSEALERHYKDAKSRYVGLHPNFLPGSTHGSDISEVVANTVSLWPEAKSFRSHYFVDSFLITQLFHRCGFKYDSNLCLYLQQNLTPLFNVSGLVRFPVFFEDDVYIDREGHCEMSPEFFKPGLKVFSFHPAQVYLNTPNVAYYQKHKKQLYEGGDCEKSVYNGRGVRTLLEDVLTQMRDHYRRNVFYLDDLFQIIPKPEMKEFSYYSKTDIDRSSFRASSGRVWSGRGLLKKYRASTREERAGLLKKVMDEADGCDRYATSGDFNLREIEIDFIINAIVDGAKAEKPRILDLGCGNGYTDLRIAQALEAEIVGVDFSTSMIEGAKHFALESKGLKASLMFTLADARDIGTSWNPEWSPETWDVIITERFLLNLPDTESQYRMIAQVHRMLKPDGIFIMVEGTRDGLDRLNKLRSSVGLKPIPDTSEDNTSSLKFREEELEEHLRKLFTIVKKQYFGMYYLISRVVHPLLVYPDEPRYDAKINEVARKVASVEPDFNHLGHVFGYVLKKKVMM